jgi:hypothetical protein
MLALSLQAKVLHTVQDFLELNKDKPPLLDSRNTLLSQRQLQLPQ